jgi:ribosomal protein L16 Arg81 hydroxylase
MIVKEIIKILDDTIYRNYSDNNVYIRNKETGILYSDVNSSIDYEYEETDIPIEKVEEENK